MRPERKRLPTFIEWLTLSALTDRHDYTGNERGMMRAAKRFHLSRAALWSLAVLTIAGLWGWISHARHVDEGFSRLLAADTSEVPSIVRELGKSGASSGDFSRLLASLATRSEDPEDSIGLRRRFHLHLALAKAEPESAHYVIKHLQELLPEQLEAVGEIFEEQKEAITPLLWQELANYVSNESDPQRLAVACLLARYDAQNAQWQNVLPWLAHQLTYVKSSQLTEWLQHLAPLDTRLAKAGVELLERDKVSSSRLSELQRELLFECIASLAAKDMDLLITALETANALESNRIHDAFIRRTEEADQSVSGSTQ